MLTCFSKLIKHDSGVMLDMEIRFGKWIMNIERQYYNTDVDIQYDHVLSVFMADINIQYCGCRISIFSVESDIVYWCSVWTLSVRIQHWIIFSVEYGRSMFIPNINIQYWTFVFNLNTGYQQSALNIGTRCGHRKYA